MTTVSVLADLLLEAHQTKDFSAVKFQPLEDLTLAFITNNDRLIANAYRSFANYQIWSLYSVLWLLGAYCELLKLTSIRVNTPNQGEYYRQLRSLKLVGGGFADFESIETLIYEIVENTNFECDRSCQETVEQIKNIFEQVEWMPTAFKEVIKGKNHLPTNKIRPTIFRKQGGFLGTKHYRQHFFGDSKFLSLIKIFLQEKIKYNQVKL